MAQLAEAVVVVGCHQIVDCQAQIPQEAFALFATAHEESCQSGEVEHGIVAAQTLELLIETIRPVAASHFVAVHQAIGEGCAHQRPQIVENGLDAILPVLVERLAAHLVDLESTTSGSTRRMAFLACRGVAHTQNSPFACRSLPGQIPLSVHLSGEISYF